MISYLLEFSILHFLFYGIYKLLLAKETQLSFLRFFLIGSTILSLIIPVIEIPSKSPLPINMDVILLPMVSTGIESPSMNLSWYIILIVFISAFFLIKLFANILQIYSWYRKSYKDSLEQIAIRRVQGLQNSFTFFNWIFIDPNHFENPGDIVRHELGHAKKLHSLDLLFFFSLTVFSWWLPSIWLMIKELKTIHEFEADEFALNISDQTYTKTLVQCTLKAHGMNLASSFDDAPIFKRLNFMKKMKKKISTWKVASIASVVAISGAMFACDEETEREDLIEGNTTEIKIDLPPEVLNKSSNSIDEVFAIVEENTSFPGGLENWAEYLSKNLTYPKQAMRLGVEGRVYVQFIVEKDGSLSDIQVLKGIGAGCDAAAKHVVENSPRWIPGKIQGKPVRQKYIQNILFKLPE